MKTLICTALVCLVQGAAFAQGAPPSAHPQPPSDAPPPPTPPPHAEVVDEVYKVTVGGEEVEVHLKPLTVRATTVAPDNGTGGFFNRLEPDARKGNDDAAHALYRSLETCKPFPKSRAELNASVEQGRAKWAATGGVQAPGDKPQDFDKWAQHQEAMFHRCEGVNDAMYETAKQLLRESVERGADQNRLYYAKTIAATDPQGAHEQYEILWQKGDIGGLAGLGASSLPHRIASAIVMGLVYGIPEEKTADFLRNMEAAVSPSAYREASKEAAQLLKNPNCCRDVSDLWH